MWKITGITPKHDIKKSKEVLALHIWNKTITLANNEGHLLSSEDEALDQREICIKYSFRNDG